MAILGTFSNNLIGPRKGGYNSRRVEGISLARTVASANHLTSSLAVGVVMGFSIRYCSTETMHPAQAYAIKQHAEQLVDGYLWHSCEPVVLDQQSDGYLTGQSKPNFYPAEIDSDVLCVLSRDHGVYWMIEHDFEEEPIGRIRDGVADDDLVEQLETVGSMGDLLDDLDETDESSWETVELGLLDHTRGDDDPDDDEPRVLKFPGTE